jgi:hypothetical protein
LARSAVATSTVFSAIFTFPLSERTLIAEEPAPKAGEKVAELLKSDETSVL